MLDIPLTDDHKYRLRALAVPGAYWDRETKAYRVINPSPRAARAATTLFPDVLNDFPELGDVAAQGLEDVRPVDYATPFATPLEVDLEGVELYDWQQTDLGFIRAVLERDGGGNLLWDRGLGKTVASAAFIGATFMHNLQPQRTLVVCRNDAKESVWRKQLSRLLPDHDIMVLPNAKAKREKALRYVRETEITWPFVFVVHYESLALIAGDGGRGKGWDALGDWDLMIFDEGHRLATMNPNGKSNTQMGRACMKARKRSTMALNLTGTYIMNHAEDLFGQLHYLFPERYKAKWRDYNDRFLDFVNVGGHDVCIGFKDEALPALRDELGRFSVFRTKAEELDLPPVIHEEVELELLPAQRKAYDQMLNEFWAALPEADGAIIATNVLAQLNTLRQMATWVPGVPSAKLDFCVNEILDNPDDQFVVFTWFKPPGRELVRRLEEKGVTVALVDGDVSKSERTRALEAHEAGEARVLIGSIETIGESLNLQYCHEAIRLDRSWNPGKNDQTFDRLVRDGQQHAVTFQDLVSVDTVDALKVRPALTVKTNLRKALFGK